MGAEISFTVLVTGTMQYQVGNALWKWHLLGWVENLIGNP